MSVKFDGKALRDRIEKAVMRGIVRGTEGVRNEAISLIQNTQKTGRIYRRGGVEHQASEPGEPPATDTGTLVASIETQYDFKNLSGTVVVRDPKAPHLEFGTINMEPRPFLRPALANRGSDTLMYIRQELVKELGK